MAVYLGETREDAILNMGMPFFEDVLMTLGRRLNYDAVVNYAGNAFCEKSWKMIQDSNPMGKAKGKNDALSGLNALLVGQKIEVVHTSKEGAKMFPTPPKEKLKGLR